MTRELKHLENKQAITEAYRVLRTNLLFASPELSPKTILFTSAEPGEGKSTVLCNTAVILAQAGHRVIAVDSDLRNPEFLFNVKNKAGLTNILVQSVEIKDCLSDTDYENIQVISSGPIPPNPADLLGTGKMKNFIAHVSGMADYILFDAPPVLTATDALILAANVDGVVLVLRAGKVQAENAARAKKDLEKVHARILGTVLNGSEAF